MTNKTFATFDPAQLFADYGRRMGAHHSRHQRMRSPSGNQ